MKFNKIKKELKINKIAYCDKTPNRQKRLSEDLIEKIDQFKDYDTKSTKSILINTAIAMNSLQALGEFTNATYDIFVACKFINHNISTTTIRKWLNKNLKIKFTYTTIKTHLKKLAYYGYISEYQNNNKKYRLENEADVTRKIIYGYYGNETFKYWNDSEHKAVLGLKYIRTIDKLRYSKKEIMSVPYFDDKKEEYANTRDFKNFIDSLEEDSNDDEIGFFGYGKDKIEAKEKRKPRFKDKTKEHIDIVNDNKLYQKRKKKQFKYQLRAKQNNLSFVKQSYTESERFNLFADYNGITKGYGDSKLLLTNKSIQDFKKNKYTSMRTFLNEALVTLFWYDRPVTKSEIIRTLHITKDVINQFKWDKTTNRILGNMKQNSNDEYKKLRIAHQLRNHKYVKEFDDVVALKKGETEEQAGKRVFTTVTGISYTKTIHTVRLRVNEYVKNHMFFDDTNYVTDIEKSKELQDLPWGDFSMKDTRVDHKTKVRYNKNTKAQGNVSSIGLESEVITSKYRKIVEKDASIITARRRTNNRHNPAYHSEIMSKYIMPKIHDRHFYLYLQRNNTRIQSDIKSLAKKQEEYEIRKAFAISMAKSKNKSTY